MDGERSRVRAVQGQLQTEVAGLLQAVKLRPVMHREEEPSPAGESASDQEQQMRQLVRLVNALLPEPVLAPSPSPSPSPIPTVAPTLTIDAAIIILEQTEYPAMSGHNTICAAVGGVADASQ